MNDAGAFEAPTDTEPAPTRWLALVLASVLSFVGSGIPVPGFDPSVDWATRTSLAPIIGGGVVLLVLVRGAGALFSFERTTTAIVFLAVTALWAFRFAATLESFPRTIAAPGLGFEVLFVLTMVAGNAIWWWLADQLEPSSLGSGTMLAFGCYIVPTVLGGRDAYACVGVDRGPGGGRRDRDLEHGARRSRLVDRGHSQGARSGLHPRRHRRALRIGEGRVARRRGHRGPSRRGVPGQQGAAEQRVAARHRAGLRGEPAAARDRSARQLPAALARPVRPRRHGRGLRGAARRRQDPVVGREQLRRAGCRRGCAPRRTRPGHLEPGALPPRGARRGARRAAGLRTPRHEPRGLQPVRIQSARPWGPNRRVLDEIGLAHGVSAHTVALAWLLRSPAVLVIPKSSDAAHVAANAAAGDLVLAPEEIARIDATFPQGARRRGVPTL